jgi:hypothetical protein
MTSQGESASIDRVSGAGSGRMLMHAHGRKISGKTGFKIAPQFTRQGHTTLRNGSDSCLRCRCTVAAAVGLELQFACLLALRAHCLLLTPGAGDTLALSLRRSEAEGTGKSAC